MKLYTDNQEHLLNKKLDNYLLITENIDNKSKLIFFDEDVVKQVELPTSNILVDQNIIFTLPVNVIDNIEIRYLQRNFKTTFISELINSSKNIQLKNYIIYYNEATSSHIKTYDLQKKEKSFFFDAKKSLKSFHIKNGSILYCTTTPSDDDLDKEDYKLKYRTSDGEIILVDEGPLASIYSLDCYQSNRYLYTIRSEDSGFSGIMKYDELGELVRLAHYTPKVSQIQEYGNEEIVALNKDKGSSINILQNNLSIGETIYETKGQIQSVIAIGKDLWDAYNGGAQ